MPGLNLMSTLIVPPVRVNHSSWLRVIRVSREKSMDLNVYIGFRSAQPEANRASSCLGSGLGRRRCRRSGGFRSAAVVMVIVAVMMIITIEPAEEAGEEAKEAHVFLLGCYRSNGIAAHDESQ